MMFSNVWERFEFEEKLEWFCYRCGERLGVGRTYVLGFGLDFL